MKNLKGMCAGLLLTSLSVSVWAGDKGGNGGGGYVCTDANKAVTRVYSYDIWSGEMDGIIIDRKKYHLKINVSNVDAYTQAREAVSRLAAYEQTAFNIFSEVLESVISKIEGELSRPVTALMLKDDYVPVRSPYQKGFCPDSHVEDIVPFRTLVNYNDSMSAFNSDRRLGKKGFPVGFTTYISDTITASLENDFLSMDQKLYLAMDNNTHRAALILHETVYKVLRSIWLHTDSKESTELTALLLADMNEDLLIKKLDELKLESKYGQRDFFDTKLNELLKAQSEEEIESIMGSSYVFRNVTISFRKKLPGLVCNQVIAPVEESLWLQDPNLGKCLWLQAFLRNNTVLMDYADRVFNPGRLFLVKSYGEKWWPLATYLKIENLQRRQRVHREYGHNSMNRAYKNLKPRLKEAGIE